jgi:hypothetical protein
VITIISLLFIPEATVAEQRDHRIPRAPRGVLPLGRAD